MAVCVYIYIYRKRKWQPTPVFLPRESCGQYSCLENPVDRGAWWAAVHRVAQRRTEAT